MERYENIIKIEEIRRLADDNEYVKAQKVLDTIDVKKIKSLTDLSIIADVYSRNEEYDKAMAVLTKIYEKNKARRILYQLVDLSIKRGNTKDAELYLNKYIRIAPKDSYRYIFRYCIDKLKNEPYEVLIDSLEQLKEYEYYEVWAYELAKLYHKAGLKDKCVRECSDIVLWFGDGIYVEKAKLLKAYYVGEINPIHILKAKDKKETEQRLGLDKTKDYSSIRSQIDRFLAENEEERNKDNVIYPSKFQKPNEADDSINAMKNSQVEYDDDIDGQAEDYVEEQVEDYEEEQYEDDIEEQAEDYDEAEQVEDYEEEQAEDYEEDKAEDDIEEQAKDYVEKQVEDYEEEQAKIYDEAEQAEDYEEDKAEDDIEKQAKDYVEKQVEDYEEEQYEDDIAEQAKDYEEDKAEDDIEKLAENYEEDYAKNYEDKQAESIAEDPREVERSAYEELLSFGMFEGYSEEEHSHKKEEEIFNKHYLEEDMDTSCDSEEEESFSTYDTKALDDNTAIKAIEEIIQNENTYLKKLFGYYICNNECNKQIVNSLERIVFKEGKGEHFIITGDVKSGRTTLGKSYAKFLYEQDFIKSPRVAKISALKLNQMQLSKNINKLLDGTLIIEEATKLSDNMLNQILHTIQIYDNKIYIILEDRKENMDMFLDKHENIQSVFGSRVDIPIFKREDLYGCALCYLEESDYKLSLEGKQIILKAIDEINENVNPNDRLEAVMDFLKRARESADNRYKNVLKNMAITKDIDYNHLMYINEEDFYENK